MPIAQANGIELYYEIHGKGEPLLLIMGLSHNCLSWKRSLSTLSKSFQVIIFDNRGTGRSSKPETPYSIELMAEDAKAVLDAANVQTANVYGISMGGMIAQRLAIAYPERVKSLVLGCTTSGGVNHVQPSAEIGMAMLSRASVTPEEAAWAAVPILYSQDFIDNHRDEIKEDIDVRLQIPTPPHGYMLQLQACLAHDTHAELDKISVPTLVIHGDDDKLVPFENGQTLSQRIKGAQFCVVPGAGHLYVTEAQDTVNKTVLEFLTAKV
ncbi:alpha/beta fold hydrolase [Mesobacillus maritimus]|uniref:alpha/beta fold hydrolase n=1 Tax=Mesobacillus maritimus TaxID=1643336 RepID=UPI00384F42E0